jgi:phage baseplate assembly protein V
MLRYGIVSETDPAKGLCRVDFAADGIVSAWLPVIKTGTLENQYGGFPDVGEHVVCGLDSRAEMGVVFGAIYSEATAPPAELQSLDVTGVKFQDGTTATYDRAASALLVDVGSAGSVTVKVGSAEHTITAQGHTIKASLSMKAWLESLLDQIVAETHPTGVGPSGPPINAPAYAALKAQLIQIFEA